MTPRRSFWRNVGVIGALHLVVLFALYRWGAERTTKPLRTDILWMSSATAASTESLPPATESPTLPAETPPPAETPAPTPPPEPEPSATPDLVVPSPTATPPPSPTPKATATPKPKKAKRNLPEPTPRKKQPAKSKPKATPAKPKKTAQPNERKTTSAKVKISETRTGRAAAGAGESGNSSGGGDPSRFNWYGNMLHDRFFGAWTQPKTAEATGSRMSALVLLRIEADGRVSKFEIVRSSGNVVVDESVNAVAKRVTAVDPLPAGMAPRGFYEVKINFELNVE